MRLTVCILATSILLAACSGGTTRVVVTPTTASTLTAEERAAGCGPVRITPPYDPARLDRSHIGSADVAEAPPLSAYASTPPTSGPHDPTPLPAGAYPTPPPVTRTIHSMEHAAVVIWFDPTGASVTQPEGQLRAIIEFLSTGNRGDHVIVAPYAYPDQGSAGRLQPDTKMALVAWHRLQTCKEISLSVAQAFVDAFRFDPDAPDRYRGEAPELGVPIG
jgi:Protein of unknown function (DUF3105)